MHASHRILGRLFGKVFAGVWVFLFLSETRLRRSFLGLGLACMFLCFMLLLLLCWLLLVWLKDGCLPWLLIPHSLAALWRAGGQVFRIWMGWDGMGWDRTGGLG